VKKVPPPTFFSRVSPQSLLPPGAPHCRVEILDSAAAPQFFPPRCPPLPNSRGFIGPPYIVLFLRAGAPGVDVGTRFSALLDGFPGPRGPVVVCSSSDPTPPIPLEEATSTGGQAARGTYSVFFFFFVALI